MKKLLFLPIFLVSLSTFAQTSAGIETQVYPAGIIPGIRFDLGISEHLNLISKVGYNVTNRRDWGKHDREEGGGLGLSLGLERSGFLAEKLFISIRADLWFMEIDWEENETICPIVAPCIEVATPGQTNITVLQPTIGLGYMLPISEKYFVKPSLSFGYEINVETDGEPVGEGAILLAGIQVGLKL